MPIINMVYKKKKWPSLKSYEEITAMKSAEAETELNTYPTEYYNKFNSEWHIYTNSSKYYLSDDGSSKKVFQKQMGRFTISVYEYYNWTSWTNETP